jgi:type IV fimbrial biogenesis protein FimT
MLIMRQRPAPGLTLIELMVTISVLVMLTSALAPSISTWLANTQIRSVASSVQAGLQRARNEAVRRNEPVRFTLVSLTDSAVMDNSCAPVASGASWVVSRDDPTGQCGTAISDTTSPRIIERRAGGVGRKSVAIQSLNGAGAASNGIVVFNGFGRVVGSTGIARIDVDNITSGDDYRALRIVIGSGGTTSLCEPKVTSADDPRHC